MPEDLTAGMAGGEQDGADEGAQGGQDGGQGDAGRAPEEIQAELEDTRAALKKANKEAADRRKRLDALEAAEQKRKDAELSEVERLQAQVDAAKSSAEAATAAANERLMRASVLAEASKLEFLDPSDAWRMVDRDGLSIGDDGEVTGAVDALKALVKAKPYLIRQKQSHDINGDRGRGDGKQPDKAAEKGEQLRQRFGI